MKISAVRPLSVEAVEFSPASAPEQNTDLDGRPFPAEPAESACGSCRIPPYQQRGGGGDVHGGGGG